MNTLWILARLTLKEAVRRKIAIASLVLGLAFLAVFNVGFHFIIQDTLNSGSAFTSRPVEFYVRQTSTFLDTAALYATNFLAIVFAVLITADTLSGEVSSGVIQVTTAKPIRRWQIVLGKWIGNAILLAGYVLLLAGGSLGGVFLQVGYSLPNFLPALALVFLNGLIVMTLALACSSGMSTLATGGTVFGLFGIAFIGGWVERIGDALENQTAANIGILSSLIMPTESTWNLASHLVSDGIFSVVGGSPFSYGSQPSPLMIGYTFVYLAACLAFAFRRFTLRDL